MRRLSLLLGGCLLLVMLALLAACAAPAESRAASSNSAIPVEVLFTVDGCTVYRFVDTRSHYFARCTVAPVTTAVTSTVEEHCGKSCRETVTYTVPAVMLPAPRPEAEP